MKDIIFSGEEESFREKAKKLGLETLFCFQKGNVFLVCENTGIQHPVMILAKAHREFREQVMSSADGFFGIEQVPSPNELHSFDHVALSMLGKKNKFVLFILQPILSSPSEERIILLERITQLMPLLRKYHISFAWVSGATNPQELRQAHDMLCFGQLLGMTPKEIKSASTLLSERIIENKKKKVHGSLYPSFMMQE